MQRQDDDDEDGRGGEGRRSTSCSFSFSVSVVGLATLEWWVRYEYLLSDDEGSFLATTTTFGTRQTH